MMQGDDHSNRDQGLASKSSQQAVCFNRNRELLNFRAALKLGTGLTGLCFSMLEPSSHEGIAY